VRTKNLNPKGHIRLPRYARAKTGVVQSVNGPWLLPDLNAERKAQVWQPVYTVVFTSRELWGEQGRERESVSLDLWEAYLEDE
jgi:nitrile hydratase